MLLLPQRQGQFNHSGESKYDDHATRTAAWAHSGNLQGQHGLKYPK
jgi:hypothetical protein